MIKLLCCTLHYETCQKSLLNRVVTLCNKRITSIYFSTFYLPGLYLYFHKTYGHHTWQVGELSWKTTSNKVTWPFDVVMWSRGKWKTLCFLSTRSMATKLDREIAPDENILSTKSHNPLITWTYRLTWQIKKVLSPFPRGLWQLNYIGGWRLIRSHKLKNHISFCSRGHVRSRDK